MKVKRVVLDLVRQYKTFQNQKTKALARVGDKES